MIISQQLIFPSNCFYKKLKNETRTTEIEWKKTFAKHA